MVPLKCFRGSWVIWYARIVTHEKASALALQLSPDMGIVPQYTPGGHYPGLSLPMVRPWFSKGKCAPGASVEAHFNNKCIKDGLDHYMQWPESFRHMDGTSTAVSYQCSAYQLQCALLTDYPFGRMETLSPSGAADLESIRGSPGRPVCFPASAASGG